MIYTQLSPTATPGRRYSFSAKAVEEEAVATAPAILDERGGGIGLSRAAAEWEYTKGLELKERISKDDNEILKMISAILPYL